MIDIIIPAYNAHKTIIKTLSSIVYQNISNLFNVYIVNDGSISDYSECIDLFSVDLNISELKLDKNKGPGVARQFGLDNSYGEYIVFIDADDFLFDSYSISNLYNEIRKCDSDIVMSVSLEETKKGYEKQVHHNGNLHGKIYRRSFIQKNKIKFNTTYTSEDNSFNQLLLLLKPKVSYTDFITYIYNNNLESLTRERIDNQNILKEYSDNMVWASQQAIKKGAADRDIAKLLFGSYLYLYLELCELNDEVILFMKKFDNEYKKYEETISSEEKQMIQNFRFKYISSIKKDSLFYKMSFDEFRLKISR